MSIWGTCVHAPKRTSAAEQRTRIMGQFQIALMSAMGGKLTFVEAQQSFSLRAERGRIAHMVFAELAFIAKANARRIWELSGAWRASIRLVTDLSRRSPPF